MSKFTREIKITPGYDHRDEPGDNRGAHGCDLFLILRGPEGAIAARISTGWMADALEGPFIRGRGAQRRRGKPGVDAGVADSYPSGSFVGAHSPVPREGFCADADSCGWLDGEPCYIDGGYLISDEILALLTTGGSDAAFERLAELYQEWIVNRPLAEQPDAHMVRCCAQGCPNTAALQPGSSYLCPDHGDGGCSDTTIKGDHS